MRKECRKTETENELLVRMKTKDGREDVKIRMNEARK